MEHGHLGGHVPPPRGGGAVDAASADAVSDVVPPLEAEHVQVRAQRPAEGDQSRLQYLLPRDVHRSRIGILRAIVGQVGEEDGREAMLALGEPRLVEERLTPLAHFPFRVRRRVRLLVRVLDLLLLLAMIPRRRRRRRRRRRLGGIRRPGGGGGERRRRRRRRRGGEEAHHVPP